MLNVRRERNVTVIEVGGKFSSLEAAALEEFGAVLLCEATHCEPPRLAVDLAATDFVGSSFIELLIRAWKRLRERRGRFVLCAVQPMCAEVLKITRLDGLLDQRPTLAAALEELGE